MMARPSRLCIHGPRPSGLTSLRPHAQRLAHSYHTVTSAHLFLRAPLAMSQVKQCQPRSLRPSRSSHSWSLYSVATSYCSVSADSVTSPRFTHGRRCADHPHHVLPLRMCPRRRLISLSPRYLLTWQCRRLSRSVCSLIPGCCRADALTQFSFPGRFYAGGFAPSVLVFS